MASEVEGVVGAFHKAKDVAAIGVPDATLGEAVMAVVVLHDSQQATEAELQDWCRDRGTPKRVRSDPERGVYSRGFLTEQVGLCTPRIILVLLPSLSRAIACFNWVETGALVTDLRSAIRMKFQLVGRWCVGSS